MLGSMFFIWLVNSVAPLLSCYHSSFRTSGNLETILLLLSWDKHQDHHYDGLPLLTSLLNSQTDVIEPIRLLFSLSKFDFFGKTEDGDNILHILSAKTSREVSSEIIWTIWRQQEAKNAKNERNREGKTPYQVVDFSRNRSMYCRSRFRQKIFFFSASSGICGCTLSFRDHFHHVSPPSRVSPHHSFSRSMVGFMGPS